MSFGVTTEGFVIKPQSTIETEIDDALKSALGPQINTLPQAVFGQLKGIFSERESLLWELAQDVYDSQYPASAEGNSLDNVNAIVANTRLAATKSTITGQALFGTLGTVIVAGDLTIFVSGDLSARFINTTGVTLIAGTNEVQRLTFSAVSTSGSFKIKYTGVPNGEETTVLINWDDSNTDIQTALNALDGLSGVTVTGSPTAGPVNITFDGDDGLQPQNDVVISDNTLSDGGAVTIAVTEQVLGVYQGQVDMLAESTGPTVANAGTLTEIETPISGIDSTFNPEDAVVGRNIETDPEYRIRRNQELQVGNAGPIEAIKSSLLELNQDTTQPEIEAVVVFENITMVTDSKDLPAKSFEAIVYQAGGVTSRDQEIADVIWESKPAGIEPHGDVLKTVTDSMGIDHTVKFSRPTELDIWLILDLTTTVDYPSDGDDQVKALMIAWGNALGVGQDIIVYPSLVAQLDDIPGITDVGVKIGTAISPTLDDNVEVDDGTGSTVELSRWDTARITVNS